MVVEQQVHPQDCEVTTGKDAQGRVPQLLFSVDEFGAFVAENPVPLGLS